MRVLVTGGAGFIGSHVVERYLALGHEVGVLDDLSTGRLDNIPRAATFFQFGLLSDQLERVLADFRPEVINHHAAQVNVRVSLDDPMTDARVNVLGSMRLFQLAARTGCRKIIYASSGGAVYGDPSRLPADENTPARPICPYGVSKYAAEKYLDLYRELSGVRTTILRYANVYGPRQDPAGEAGVVAIFAETLLAGKQPTIFGDGSKTRDYVYVGDIAEANCLALEAGDGGVYNVGLGRQVSDDEIFQAVRSALGVKIEAIHADFRKGEVRHISLDAGRIRADLGWRPSVTLEQGIPKAAAYYRERHENSLDG